MFRACLAAPLAVCAAAIVAAPATAADDNLQFWFNPSVSADLGGGTGVELETAQRLRDADDGGTDTYYARAWVTQEIGDAITVAAGIERRANDGGADETRALQQVAVAHGIWRGRARIEQRWVEGAARTGWRLRTRAGVSVPLGAGSPLSVAANAETFWTIEPVSIDGQSGLTGLRTQLVLGWDVSDRLSLSLGYVRAADIVRGGQDRVGHAPIVGIEFGF